MKRYGSFKSPVQTIVYVGSHREYFCGEQGKRANGHCTLPHIADEGTVKFNLRYKGVKYSCTAVAKRDGDKVRVHYLLPEGLHVCKRQEAKTAIRGRKKMHETRRRRDRLYRKRNRGWATIPEPVAA